MGCVNRLYKTIAPSLLALLAVAVALPCAPAQAGVTVRVGKVRAHAGQPRVVVPIYAKSDQPLTVLAVELRVPPKLCRAIRKQRIRPAGRTTSAAMEIPPRCTAGKPVKVVFTDLSGKTVIPAGRGRIAEWVFKLRRRAPAGIFPLVVSRVRANQGPLDAAVKTVAGKLTVSPHSRRHAQKEQAPRR